MKKIIAILALTLCAIHNSGAMLGPIRQNISRFGQHARQYAQQAAPTCRTFASKASNLRPQNFGWLRNMQTYARNANLPSMRTAAVGLGGLGLGAAYLQRPEFLARVKAEEERKPADILNDVRSRLNDMVKKPYAELEWTSLKHDLNILALNNNEQMTAADRKNFTSIMNDLLNLRELNIRHDLDMDLQKFGDPKNGASIFLINSIINILLTNAAMHFDQIPSNEDIVVPTVYKKLFNEINKDSNLKTIFIEAIKDINNYNAPNQGNAYLLQFLPDREDRRAAKLTSMDYVILRTQGMANLRRIIDAISREIENKPASSWWWPF